MLLDQLIAEIEELEPEERLEWVVEFADELPELPPDKRSMPFPESCRVQECQTPVHLWLTVVDDRIHLEADVPQKSPTVRGLVALVVRGLEGASVAEGLSLPDDLAVRLGLASVLGMTRQQGFRGVISRIKQSLRACSK